MTALSSQEPSGEGDRVGEGRKPEAFDRVERKGRLDIVERDLDAIGLEHERDDGLGIRHLHGGGVLEAGLEVAVVLEVELQGQRQALVLFKLGIVGLDIAVEVDLCDELGSGALDREVRDVEGAIAKAGLASADLVSDVVIDLEEVVDEVR